jgi:hypothetical protein
MEDIAILEIALAASKGGVTAPVADIGFGWLRRVGHRDTPQYGLLARIPVSQIILANPRFSSYPPSAL